MTRRVPSRIALGVIALAALGGALALSVWLASGPRDLDDQTLARAVMYRTLDPRLDMEAAVSLVRESEAWHQEAAHAGKSVSELLAETEVTEAEARAWYQGHRHLFGPRPFEAVQVSVVKMARLEKLQRRLSSPERP